MGSRGYDFDVLVEGHFSILVSALRPSPNVLPNELKMKNGKLKIAKQKSFPPFWSILKMEMHINFGQKMLKILQQNLNFFEKMRKNKMLKNLSKKMPIHAVQFLFVSLHGHIPHIVDS